MLFIDVAVELVLWRLRSVVVIVVVAAAVVQPSSIPEKMRPRANEGMCAYTGAIVSACGPDYDYFMQGFNQRNYHSRAMLWSLREALVKYPCVNQGMLVGWKDGLQNGEWLAFHDDLASFRTKDAEMPNLCETDGHRGRSNWIHLIDSGPVSNQRSMSHVRIVICCPC